VAVKVAVVALADTVTEAGTVKTDAALLERVTTVAAVVDLESVTVQVVLALDVKLAAAHCKADTVTGATGAIKESAAD
jgi:hypothetical protein